MKNSKLTICLFVLAVAIQLAAPLYMAWHWENILQTGQLYYWPTAPVDPYDAFKGWYIDLNFKENSGPILDNDALDYRRPAYALIKSDADGKAVIRGITAKQPGTDPYIKVRVIYIDHKTAHIELPFKRYYLPENLALTAENIYREKQGTTGVAAVRIKDGYGVIEQLYINGKTLEEYLHNL